MNSAELLYAQLKDKSAAELIELSREMSNLPEYSEAIAQVFHERDLEEVGAQRRRQTDQDRALQRRTPWSAWIAILVAVIALAIALLCYGPHPVP